MLKENSTTETWEAAKWLHPSAVRDAFLICTFLGNKHADPDFDLMLEPDALLRLSELTADPEEPTEEELNEWDELTDNERHARAEFFDFSYVDPRGLWA